MATDSRKRPQNRWEGFGRRLLNTVRCYPKLFFLIVLPLFLLIVAMVVLQAADIPVAENVVRHEYCRQCGLVRESERWYIVNVTASCSEEIHRTFITDWLEKRLGQCTDHRWILARMHRDTYELLGGIHYHNGDGNKVWLPIYEGRFTESVRPFSSVLDKLEQADADRARQLTQSLLGEDYHQAWDVLHDLSFIRNPSPDELLDALNRIEARNERQ